MKSWTWLWYKDTFVPQFHLIFRMSKVSTYLVKYTRLYIDNYYEGTDQLNRNLYQFSLI